MKHGRVNGSRHPSTKSMKETCFFLLPKITIPPPPYRVTYEFGLSSKLADWDNPVKPAQDVLQKKYGFNDRDIIEGHVFTKLTKKRSGVF